ncbi:MAG TPA: S8 family serine peptidase, partial [Candidatus Limnocylindrales bacterium]
DADIAEAFDYAADMGARVVNAALGGPGATTTLRLPITTHPNTLFVVAAGNESANNELGDGSYPCNYPDLNVVCVAATTQSDGLASFSNFGSTSVDLGAPGTGIYSTVPGNSAQPAAFGFMSGTSMATPHVSGALSLLLAHKPALTAAQACASVLDSGDLASSLAGKTHTGRRLNVFNALRADPAPVASTGTASSLTTTGATLGGTIGSRCATTRWQFEYGPTQAYGTSTPMIGVANRAEGVSAAINGLTPATTYHYRLVGAGGSEHFTGADATFTTGSASRTSSSTHDEAPPVTTPPVTETTATTPSLRERARATRVTCTRARRTLRCRVTRAGTLGLRLTVKRSGRVVSRGTGRAGKRIALKAPKAKPGRYTITVTLLENGDRASATKRIRIR